MFDLVVLVPVLGRPHRVAPLIDSINESMAEPFRLLFIGSPGDDLEHAAVKDAGADLLVIDDEPASGDYARKINAGYRETVEPLLFLAADDLHFHADWFEQAAAKLEGSVQVVGTNDLGNPRVMAGDHSTHTLVTRWYVDTMGTADELGKVLHEGYPHEFVDDELVATAKHRGAWAFAADSHVEHLHPNWSKSPMDPLYAQQPKRMRVGRRIYEQRRPLWT